MAATGAALIIFPPLSSILFACMQDVKEWNFVVFRELDFLFLFHKIIIFLQILFLGPFEVPCIV